MKKVNVGRNERLVSVAGAGALAALALARRMKASLPIALGEGYHLFRGLSGRCYVYEALDITRVGEDGAGGL